MVHGLVQSDVVWFYVHEYKMISLFLCATFKDKTLSFIRVNMVMIAYICTVCDDITCVYCIIYRGNSPFLGADTQLFKKILSLIWNVGRFNTVVTSISITPTPVPAKSIPCSPSSVLNMHYNITLPCLYRFSK